MFSLTVVIPTFNSAFTLGRTMASIFQQSVAPEEVIIVDGGSTDCTLQLVSEFIPRIRVISEPDQGPYDAMNKGLLSASCDVVAILNSDDMWLPGTTEKVLIAFQDSAHDVGIVHGKVRYCRSDGTSQVIAPSQGLMRWSGLGLPSVHPATFIQRNVYRRLGNYSLKYPICADQDFVYRCLASGIQDLFIDEILTEMHAGGLSSRVDYRNEIRALHDSFPLLRRLVARFLWRLFEGDISYFNGVNSLRKRELIHFVIRRLQRAL